MTCRHKAGDPDCTSRRYSPPDPPTPDKANYEIVEFLRVGNHIVTKVKYPNCISCSYEGHKVMVFLNITEAAVIKWREIDPHFRDPKKIQAPNQAPSPAARFPASPEGWQDALDYAKIKK